MSLSSTLNKARFGFRIFLQGEHILLITLPVPVTNCKGLELISSADDIIDVQDASVCGGSLHALEFYYHSALNIKHFSLQFSGVPRGGGVGCPPPPKFRRPSKIVPNSTTL